MHQLAKFVLRHIREHGLLRAGDRVGVAVSGGADSVALLMLLRDLRAELGIVLSVVHFNHKLRGVESDEDEQFVRELSAKSSLPFISESGDVKAHATEKKISLETAARDLRYTFFRRLILSEELDHIATAHTLDDQAETVLLKLLRGAGSRGLAGIYPRVRVGTSAVHPHLEIIRPLLGIHRPDIEQYLREQGQNWHEDSSNRDLRHTRNRVRHEVLPQLEQLNPRIRETLAELAEIARGEEEYWEQQVSDMLWQAWKSKKNSGELDWEFLRKKPLAIQRQLLRAAAESLGISLQFRHVEEILALSHPGRAALPENWAATLRKGVLRFEHKHSTAPEYEYVLPVPAKIVVQEAGVEIEAEMLSTRSGGYGSEDLLDSSLAGGSLIVRNWRLGDRFWPAHSKAPKKIKELLQDRHLAGDEKKLWPVVASGDEVVWVRGLGVRRDFRATNGSGILIRAVQLGSQLFARQSEVE